MTLKWYHYIILKLNQCKYLFNFLLKRVKLLNNKLPYLIINSSYILQLNRSHIKSCPINSDGSITNSNCSTGNIDIAANDFIIKKISITSLKVVILNCAQLTLKDYHILVIALLLCIKNQMPD